MLTLDFYIMTPSALPPPPTSSESIVILSYFYWNDVDNIGTSFWVFARTTTLMALFSEKIVIRRV